MRSLLRPSVRSKLTALILLFVVGFLAFSGVAYTTFETFRVNGRLYKELIRG